MITKYFKELFLFIWQLPQNLLGLLLLLIYKDKKLFCIKNGVRVYNVKKFISGVSLGRYILLSPSSCIYDKNAMSHELGHAKQSLYLGWFYLIAVGVPSFILFLLARINKTVYINYYNYYPEKWADKLGKVKR